MLSFLVVMKCCFGEIFRLWPPCCKETIGLHNKLTAQPCLTLRLSRKCKTNKHFPEPNNWLARFPTKRNIVQLERKKKVSIENIDHMVRIHITSYNKDA